MIYDEFVQLDGTITAPKGFTLTCDKCGSTNTRLIPTHHYDNDYSKPEMITLELFCCRCSNKYIGIIDKK